MPQTPSAIPYLSSRSASPAVVKPLSQPSKDQATAFASLLGVETRTKAGAVSKKRSASSTAEAQDNVAAPSLGASPKSAASNQPNLGQLIPASVLTNSVSSYIPISSAEARGAEVLRTPNSTTGGETVSKLSNSAVLLRSETHFAPEQPIATAGNAVPSQTVTDSPSQNEAEAAGQTDLAPLQQQFTSEPETPNADPRTDIQAKISRRLGIQPASVSAADCFYAFADAGVLQVGATAGYASGWIKLCRGAV